MTEAVSKLQKIIFLHKNKWIVNPHQPSVHLILSNRKIKKLSDFYSKTHYQYLHLL